MSERSSGAVETLLHANAAFYEAFAAGDFVAMQRVWSEDTTVSCLHPGWSALRGRDAVLGSWRAILQNPMVVQTRAEVADIVGEVGIVVCVEVLRGVELAATNVFVREAGSWRMILHQAGLISRRQSSREDEGPGPGRLLN